MMKSILLGMLFFVGAAVAAPTEIDERVKYTASLNSMASIIMGWYGSLISTKGQMIFKPISSEWDSYRSRYPKNISQIQITSTDLTKLDTLNEYQFVVNSVMNYNRTHTKNKSIREVFVFQVNPFSQPIIKNVSRDKIGEAEKTPDLNLNRDHYKIREFAYSWLAYLDGVEMMKPQIDADKWFQQAIYSVKIGGKKITGTLASTMAERKQYLTKGGHLLRSIDVKEIEGNTNHYMLNLVVEWKGVNQDGKPVLAKIHQQITYQIQNDTSWKVLSIQEEHLLPDIAPWSGLLC